MIGMPSLFLELFNVDGYTFSYNDLLINLSGMARDAPITDVAHITVIMKNENPFLIPYILLYFGVGRQVFFQ